MSEKLNWRTSSYTGTETCVEVADDAPAGVMVRDSKNRNRGAVTVHPAAWRAFVASTKGSDRS
ncbi:DUF397 domain-containing protein [Streptomyces sp. NPDC059982]|uniref:DUF397 domain-containing protein n=1 Tax=unclassified Streptomyces TaxID=2593676 RepID=UPI0036780656